MKNKLNLEVFAQTSIANNKKSMKFSQKIGKKPVRKDIQNETMDEELKNGLWNIIKMFFIDKLRSGGIYEEPEIKEFSKILWHNFYKKSIDSIPNNAYKIELEIRTNFYKSEWYEVYDFVEFIVSIQADEYAKKDFIQTLNKLLEIEFSGYRIINEVIAPISNQLEFDEVNYALKKTKYLTALKGANIHLSNAIELISDKKNPNYRNSVKESISAVESACRKITSENTLGKSLNKLESKGIIINKQLKTGFEKIYAYTNDKDNGIRHAIVTEPNEPDFSDAKYMLISCSAFINFLVSKAEKIGMNLD